MNIDLELYRVFYFVAKNKHMTKASQELNISQPAISQTIRKLEEQIGGALFLRSNKGMTLTEEGEMLFNYVSRALEIINSAEIEFTSYKNLSKGKLNIGASTTLTKLFLLDRIEIFLNKFPGVEINIINGLTSDLLLDLQNSKLDLVIFNESSLIDPSLNLKTIGSIKHGFVYNPNYFEDKILNFNNLNEYPLILQKSSSNTRKFLDNLALKNNVILHPNMEVVSQELITEFVNKGLGVGFVMIDLAKRNYPYLKELNINKEIPSVDIYLATNKHLTFACIEFLKLFNEKN